MTEVEQSAISTLLYIMLKSFNWIEWWL